MGLLGKAGHVDSQPCAHARTFLFVPGNRPALFGKAARSGADVVILDLEDSVPAAEKEAARAAIADAWPTLAAAGTPVTVRVNALDSAPGPEDLRLAQDLRVQALVVPKAESPALLRDALARVNGAAAIPLIESAAGLAELDGIAALAGVLRLCIGHLDFMADTGIECDEDENELLPLRFAVTMATRTHDLAPPVDGVTAKFDDDERLRRDVRRALRLGFGAKLCIHPRQVPVVHDTLAPTADDLDLARRVLAADAASGGKATQLDGSMIDFPVVLRARRMLARAGGA